MDNPLKKISKSLRYSKNPRAISVSDQEQLKAHLLKFGDLSGVVYCRNNKAYVGGNQRSEIFDSAEITLLEEYKQPQHDKTIAIGFINWNGNKYIYREVMFTEEEFREACVAANNDGGEWDKFILSTEWLKEELEIFGFDVSILGNVTPNDPSKEFKELGEFQFVNRDNTAWKQLIVNFENEENYKEFTKVTGLLLTEKTKSVFYPKKNNEKTGDIYGV